MLAGRNGQPRWGRHGQGFLIVLTLLFALSLLSARYLGPEQAPDPRPLWERLLASLLLLGQCAGIVFGVLLLATFGSIIRQIAINYQMRRLEARRAVLQPLSQDANLQATLANLSLVSASLHDRDEDVRKEALAAAFTLLRADPSLGAQGRLRVRLEETLPEAFGFARTLAETALNAPLLERVTLGAKLGAGSCHKKISHVTSDPANLAHWLESQRRPDVNQEVQVSIGYDTGSLPWLEERGRFVALYLFIATTDLKRFMALMRRPPRDPNAAYGLVIRGDVVEVRYPGQGRGRRLDYVFPLPLRLSTANLGGLVRQIQLLNLGLLVACSADAARVLLPGPAPVWLDWRRQAIASCYRDFERRLVALLRRHDRFRDVDCIHRLSTADHDERVRAFQLYRLEECLYPQYSWVVPLYDADTRWDRLLDPLRGVEAMLLHQGNVPRREVTRGMRFIQKVRRLGYETTVAIEEVLAAAAPVSDGTGSGEPPAGGSAGAAILLDPFIDPREEKATRHYLTRVGQALAQREAWPELLPDPGTFRKAAAYYQVANESPSFPTELIPEVDK
jgi:hypothetical protein